MQTDLQRMPTVDPPIPITQDASIGDVVLNTTPVSLTTISDNSIDRNTTNTNSTILNSTTSSVDPHTINSVCTLLHHQDHTHYILSRFCQPVPTSIDPTNPPLCKYGI
jgi:DNA-binding MurR/RpiR family transcriptional regulator